MPQPEFLARQIKLAVNGGLPTSPPETEETPARPFPRPNEVCFHGLAGAFVKMVEPHTEADPMALLIQFLTAFGSVTGREPFYQVESDKHHTNLFTVLVGQTGAARKGTSWGRVRDVFRGIDERWERDGVISGLSSGEGLLNAVRDAQTKEKLNDYGETEITIFESGIEDKRILVYEGEFAGVLRAQGREGNNLSVYIRNSWDTGNIRALTKNSPLRATNAHVSLIGHITPAELTDTLKEVEAANGYANRFLWICVRRSKLLPFGGNLNDDDLNLIRCRLKDRIEFARSVKRVLLSSEARELWAAEYRRLETSRTGYMARLTQRASPYVMRLALIYALLDMSDEISVDHLGAALAVWQYSEESVRFIFGFKTGDDIADRLLTALQQVGAEGMTRTQISEHFKRNVEAEKIKTGLQLLSEQGLVEMKAERKLGAKRDTETWFATFTQNDSCEFNEFNEFNETREVDVKFADKFVGDSPDTNLTNYKGNQQLSEMQDDKFVKFVKFVPPNTSAAGNGHLSEPSVQVCQNCKLKILEDFDDCPQCQQPL